MESVTVVSEAAAVVVSEAAAVVVSEAAAVVVSESAAVVVSEATAVVVSEATAVFVSEATAEVKNEIHEEFEKLVVVVPDEEVKEIAVLTEFKKKNLIHVSNVKKPFFFYYNLSKRYIKQYNEVELTALGMAIPTAVTIAEILKKNGLAMEKNLSISSVSSMNGENDRLVMKPKIEIALVNVEKIKNITTATTSEDC